ncbi:ATP-binding protein [Ensifer adhaerens]|uniref:ATP-binding protein n=1 Tax=Ensifer adhaerens TaxID=106592 RepID=UPI00098F6577|nr:ATP-binding protein [Ensifer adhaerens]
MSDPQTTDRAFGPASGSQSKNREWASGGFSWLLTKHMFLAVTATIAVLTLASFVYMYIFHLMHPDAALEPITLADFLALGAVLTVSLVIAAIIGGRLSQPIVNALVLIRDAAKAIAMGNFSTRVPVRSGRLGEVDDVIDHFNRMAELLENAENELRYQNNAIAHELRTPLTVLRGRLQGMRDGLFNPTTELYDGLIGQIDHLTGIVEDLRILALSNVGRLELRPEPGDMGDEAETAVATMLGEFDKAGMPVSLNLDRVPMTLDRVKVRQALLAILHNATRYAPGSRLSVATKMRGSQAIFQCQDSGPGMSDIDIEHAFDRFWRADDSRSRASGGSGLGLSVVRAIAEAHGGSTSARRNEFGGMTFEISLPTDCGSRGAQSVLSP